MSCCESSDYGFPCTCYKRGPTLETIDEQDERGDAEYHRRKDEEDELL